METVSNYINSLDLDTKRDPLVADTVAALQQMQIDEVRQHLLEHIEAKRGKPYLHALESDKLQDLSYDEVIKDVGSLSAKLGTVYLHIPFCVKRCTHCHYYKEIGVRDEIINGFPAYLGKELSIVLERFDRDKVAAYSVHFGGGTPSLLSIAQWGDLLERVMRFVTVEGTDEVTIESSPEDITREKMGFWKANGINRISLGTQSFDNASLAILRRNHDAEIAEQSYQFAVEAGFENINIDLMYGMPGRTLDSWLLDVRKILALRPESVTIYATRPDPSDMLERNLRFPGDNERIFCHLLAAQAFLDMGYIQYSPNQFIRTYKGACTAKRERNRCHDVLGIGPLAHSIVKNWFYYNKANLDVYQSVIGGGSLSKIKGGKMSLEEEKVRYIQFGLKLSGINKPCDDNGVLRDAYQQNYGEPVEQRFGSKITHLQNQDLLVAQNGNFHLTEKGILLNRDVLRYFASREEHSAAGVA
jgi:oxygen-independent coproporphyrinogen-3 oxidase